MRSAPAAYFRDEEKQAHYRDLVAARDSMGSEGALTVDDGKSLLPIPSYTEWVKETGSGAGYDDLLKGFRTAADYLFAVPAAEQKALIAGIEALPQELGEAMIAEILSPMPSVAPSGDTAVANFKERDDGAILSREWGPYTARNLARVRQRLFRVIDRLEHESSVAPFIQWLDGLSTPVAVALYRKLAA